MTKTTNCLERAGHIFMLINWTQGILVDLILFKKHPKALSYFIKNGKTSLNLGKKRRLYWQRNFSEIRKEFCELFPNIPSNWGPLLDDLNNKRDMIAHCNVSLYREYILYQPDMRRGKKNIKTKLKGIRRAVDGKVTAMTLFRLRFDDENYQNMIDGILEFDTKLFPAISNEMGFDYDRLR